MSTSCIKKLETKKIISLRRPPLTKQHEREKTLDVLTQKEQQEQSEVEEGIEYMEKHKQRQRKIKEKSEDHTGNTKTPTLFWKRSVTIEYRDTLIQK